MIKAANVSGLGVRRYAVTESLLQPFFATTRAISSTTNLAMWELNVLHRSVSFVNGIDHTHTIWILGFSHYVTTSGTSM